MTKGFCFAAAALALGAGMAAAEGTGAQGYFNLHNDTADHVLIGFYTNDGIGWSANWIDGEAVLAGESLAVQFLAPEGACAQQISAGWEADDGSEVLDEPFNIDICDTSNVYLGDNEITYD